MNSLFANRRSRFKKPQGTPRVNERISYQNLIKIPLRSLHLCGYVVSAFLKIGGADSRRKKKTPAGVLFARRGLFFLKQRRRCPYIFKRNIETYKKPCYNISDDRKMLEKHRQKLQTSSPKKCKKFCKRT